MLDLSLPTTEAVKEEIVQQLLPTPEENTAIATTVEQQTAEIMSVDIDSITQRKEYANAMESFGDEILKQSAKSNAILERRVGQLGIEGGETGEVAKSLEDLTIKMRDLDPSGIDFLKTGTFGKLFNPVRRYFEKFKTADAEISEIVKSLEKGKKTLINDNTTLEIEQDSMRELTKKLNQSIEMGLQLDASVSNAVENAKVSGENPDKIKFIEEELLYPLRQRVMDFQQLLAVNQQGIVAMEMIRKNNKELIRSVDRAKLVTVNALRTAVTVGGALYDEKIVLEKVTALNETTNNMIEATSKMLKEQGTQIHKQAAESQLNAETLKQAFADTLSALDEINNYKQEALPRLKSTIEDFQTMVVQGEKEIQKLEESRDVFN
ncbi:MAG: toxic anion resistance protein [Lachnospiraceae bacterium]|nr:toxic anion resistance protein [Lachnospiraceae bacterium]